ncbi:hypothetical protein CAPTEDRAFT_218504 [Capitella teleta]|uniref:Uncharacterized protein n=1 Tax=Capitella teleta TaxID=283909 RepID=R7VJE0_CAPTE|nr:hypothetical protein CAPTEDRAFT_218504 [Capitella teleta]|eukprot:ELU18774.1 hypothetical protein CAPTEDRAFT_218504 [Capitella teleta]
MIREIWLPSEASVETSDDVRCYLTNQNALLYRLLCIQRRLPAALSECSEVVTRSGLELLGREEKENDDGVWAEGRGRYQSSVQESRCMEKICKVLEVKERRGNGMNVIRPVIVEVESEEVKWNILKRRQVLARSEFFPGYFFMPGSEQGWEIGLLGDEFVEPRRMLRWYGSKRDLEGGRGGGVGFLVRREFEVSVLGKGDDFLVLMYGRLMGLRTGMVEFWRSGGKSLRKCCFLEPFQQSKRSEVAILHWMRSRAKIDHPKQANKRH